MKPGALNNWQAVQAEVLARIQSRQWKPGELIPNEADLAQEFGCARATVNRALQALADAGLLDRRRKAGTRVARHPVRKATMQIPILRNEIIGKGHDYGYALISSERRAPPTAVARLMGLSPRTRALHVVCLHSADQRPYVLEDRWLNPDWVSASDEKVFATISPNEWLVMYVPFTVGDIAFTAAPASEAEAGRLECRPGDAVFVMERTTRNDTAAVTAVRLVFAPGYRVETAI